MNQPRSHIAMLFLASVLAACATPRDEHGRTAEELKAQIYRAKTLFDERCKTVAGITIKRTIQDVDGFLLMKLRPTNYSPYKQDAEDPYGYDFDWDDKDRAPAYVGSFLTWADQVGNAVYGLGSHLRKPLLPGYKFVDAVDRKDQKRYRYTGRYEEPWTYNKSYLEGYVRFVVDKAVPTDPSPQFGITYEDITTPYERQHWIAGSSLKVVDLATGEVIAERIGYMIDFLQGATPRGRQPWTFARTKAGWSCPQIPMSHPTRRFVEQVLVRRQHDGSELLVVNPPSPIGPQ